MSPLPCGRPRPGKFLIFCIYLIFCTLQNCLICLVLSIGSMLVFLVLKNAVECTSQRLKWTSGARVMTKLVFPVRFWAEGSWKNWYFQWKSMISNSLKFQEKLVFPVRFWAEGLKADTDVDTNWYSSEIPLEVRDSRISSLFAFAFFFLPLPCAMRLLHRFIMLWICFTGCCRCSLNSWDN